MTARSKILIVDNDENDLFLWRAIVESFGHQVFTVSGGKEAIGFLKDQIPDLILLDLKMPEMSGIDVSNYLRRQPRYQSIPIIMLTSSDDLGDKLKSFEHGVDDYITKEMDHLEIEKRIEAVLKRFKQNMDTNPLTHLPGNNTIQREIQKRIQEQYPFAVAYCDLDNFKAFNDAYGFIEGDRVIRFCAGILEDAVFNSGNPDDFVGHIGGDDFIFLTTPDKIDSLCAEILNRFEKGVVEFYSAEDRQRGYFVAVNRQGEQKKFPFVSLSIAVVTNRHRQIGSLAEVSRIASEIKKLAKEKSGNVYVVDQRTS